MINSQKYFNKSICQDSFLNFRKKQQLQQLKLIEPYLDNIKKDSKYQLYNSWRVMDMIDSNFIQYNGDTKLLLFKIYQNITANFKINNIACTFYITTRQLTPQNKQYGLIGNISTTAMRLRQLEEDGVIGVIAKEGNGGGMFIFLKHDIAKFFKRNNMKYKVVDLGEEDTLQQMDKEEIANTHTKTFFVNNKPIKKNNFTSNGTPMINDCSFDYSFKKLNENIKKINKELENVPQEQTEAIAKEYQQEQEWNKQWGWRNYNNDISKTEQQQAYNKNNYLANNNDLSIVNNGNNYVEQLRKTIIYQRAKTANDAINQAKQDSKKLLEQQKMGKNEILIENSQKLVFKCKSIKINNDNYIDTDIVANVLTEGNDLYYQLMTYYVSFIRDKYPKDEDRVIRFKTLCKNILNIVKMQQIQYIPILYVYQQMELLDKNWTDTVCYDMLDFLLNKSKIKQCINEYIIGANLCPKYVNGYWFESVNGYNFKGFDYKTDDKTKHLNKFIFNKAINSITLADNFTLDNLLDFMASCYIMAIPNNKPDVNGKYWYKIIGNFQRVDNFVAINAKIEKVFRTCQAERKQIQQYSCCDSVPDGDFV